MKCAKGHTFLSQTHECVTNLTLTQIQLVPAPSSIDLCSVFGHVHCTHVSLIFFAIQLVFVVPSATCIKQLIIM